MPLGVVHSWSNPADAASRLDWAAMTNALPAGIRCYLQGLQPATLKNEIWVLFEMGVTAQIH